MRPLDVSRTGEEVMGLRFRRAWRMARPPLGRTARIVSVQLALATAILTGIFAGAPRAQHMDMGSAGGLPAKIGVLQRLSRAGGARLWRLFSYPAARRPANRIFGKSAAGVHRASAHQQRHVQRGAYVEPGYDRGSCRAFPEFSIQVRSAGLQSNSSPWEGRYSKTACPTPISRHAPPAMGRTPAAADRFRGWRASSIPMSSRNW